jgi:hypothetical protein
MSARSYLAAGGRISVNDGGRQQGLVAHRSRTSVMRWTFDVTIKHICVMVTVGTGPPRCQAVIVAHVNAALGWDRDPDEVRQHTTRGSAHHGGRKPRVRMRQCPHKTASDSRCSQETGVCQAEIPSLLLWQRRQNDTLRHQHQFSWRLDEPRTPHPKMRAARN